MLYRTLGKTGLEVSQLGFGAMRLPMVSDDADSKIDRELAIPMIHKAFEQGVNYIDTAVGYCHGDSQYVVGEALKGWRDKIVVSTKNPFYELDEKRWFKNLEDSLERLGVDYIDIYNHHGINWEKYTNAVEPTISKWMQRAKDQGMIKHICCSVHDNCENVIKLINTGYPEVLTVQYNILDRKLEEAIKLAHEKGIGIIVMGPVGGGRLGDNSQVLEKLTPAIKAVPELAMRFVLANPYITVALSGMSTMQHVEENIAAAASEVTLSDADLAAIDEHLTKLEKMVDLYCTGCGYCLPCPADVQIPKIFERYNWGRTYGLWNVASERYHQIGRLDWDKGNRADACVDCGKCEDKCPQNIPIRQQLKEAHEKLTASK